MQLHRAMLIGVSVIAVIAIVAYLRLDVPAGRDTLTAVNQPQSLVVSAKSGVTSVEDMSILREEVASLRTELLELRRGQGARLDASAGTGRQPRPGPRNATEESGADPRRNAMSREEAAREHEARVASIDASYRKEVIDPAWSASTSSRIQSVLSSEEMGHMQADSIECRSESCRVELREDGSGQLNKSIPILAIRLAGMLQNITADSVTRPDGRVSMVLYLSSQSQAAPSVTR